MVNQGKPSYAKISGREWLILAAIFLLVLGSRLYFAFSTENFDYDAYFNLRQTKYIMETGLPNYNDALSYGGRFYTFLPLFHYIIAVFGKIIGLELSAKIVPNVLASLLTIVVFLLCRDMTKSSGAALLSAFLSGFVPVFFSQTINNVSILTGLTTFMFFLMYCFINIKSGQNIVIMYIVSFIVVVLLHPISLLFIVAIYFYLLLCKLEGMKISNAEFELPIFSTFLWLWANLVIYKKAFLIHGISIIWQNLPPQLFRQNFADINLIQTVLGIGIIPFLFGLYIIYRGFFGEKEKPTYLFVAFAFSTAIMLWLKLITLSLGFIFLGVVLAILFSRFYLQFSVYIENTKFSHYRPYIVVGLIAVFFITSVFPSFYEAASRDYAPSAAEVDAMEWINAHSPPQSTVLASPEEGHMLAYYSRRKNVADTNFLLVKNIDQILDDTREIYTTRFKTKAISLITKYDIDYIYISDRTRENIGIDDLLYADESCILKLYDQKNIKIYGPACVLEEG